jgi:hypothetical protein
MRWILVITALSFVAVLMACKEDTRIELTVNNNTDSSLCYYEVQPFEGFCPQVMPHLKAKFATACVRGGDTLTPIVLTDGPGGREIYKAAATCRDWKQSGATITVEKPGGQFVVTDRLPEVTPSPP